MTALVSSLGDFIRTFVEAFNFSTIFPAATFVFLMRLCLLPILPEDSIRTLVENWDEETQIGLAFVFIIFLSVLLNAANVYIIRLFEGYPWMNLPLFKAVTRNKRDYVKDTLEVMRECDEVLCDLRIEIQEHDRDDLCDLAKKLKNQQLTLNAELDNRFPTRPDYVLPTTFGNVIASAEEYPFRVLGMDAVVLWPFLLPILARKNYVKLLMAEKTSMDFLLNLAVVLIAFGGLIGVVMLYYQGLSWNLGLVLTLIAFASWWMARLAVYGATAWASMVKTAFLLFRKDLQGALGLRKPQGYADEVILWNNTSNFLRAFPLESLYIKELGQNIFDPYYFYTRNGSEAQEKT